MTPDAPRPLHSSRPHMLHSQKPHGIFMAPATISPGMTNIAATEAAAPDSRVGHGGPRDRLPILMLGAVGVVYGDIGTSPLYAMKESFIGPHPMAVDPLHIFGVISLIFWSLMLIVTV